MTIKTIFRGYGKNTQFKIVERIGDWPSRLFKGDIIEINECQYEVVLVILRVNEIIVQIVPFINEIDHFDNKHWYRID